MIIFRFMSMKEFDKYRNEKVLINNKIHEGNTNSVGFCFLNIEDFKPEDAMHFLSGIVSFDICAIFETNINLSETYGVYAKPVKETGNINVDFIKLLLGFNERFVAKEYCITSYNKTDFKLLKYSKDIWKQYDEITKQPKLKWKEG